MVKNVHYNRKTNMYTLWSWNNETKKTEVKTSKLTRDFYVDCHPNQSNTPMKSAYGNSLMKKPLDMNYQQAKAYRQELRDSGLKSYGMTTKPESEAIRQNRLGLSNDYTFGEAFRVASIDIEVCSNDDDFPNAVDTDYPVNLITTHDSITNEVTIFSLFEEPDLEKELADDQEIYDGVVSKVNFIHIADEKKLLFTFFSWFKSQKFDIMTGWFIQGFDIPYLVRRYAKFYPSCIVNDDARHTEYRVPFGHNDSVICRKAQEPKVVKQGKKKKKGMDKWAIAGLSILDGLDLYKNFTYTMQPSYKLDAICFNELKIGKVESEYTMGQFWRKDWGQYVRYNIRDVALLVMLERKVRFIELTTQICSLALCPLEDIYSSMAVISGITSTKLYDRGKLSPDAGYHEQIDMPLVGGFVMAIKGLHRYTKSDDFESLYPKMIESFNVSPETKVTGISKEEAIAKGYALTPIEGVYYKQDKQGIVPSIVMEIFEERKYWKKEMIKAKQKGDKVYADYCFNQQLIRKILINSFYGVMGHEAFPYFDLHNANVITAGGRDIIKWSSKCTNKKLKSVSKEELQKKLPKLDCSGWTGATTDDSVVLIDTDSNYTSLFDLYTQIGRAKDDEWLTTASEDEQNLDFLNFANYVDINFLAPFNKIAIDKWAERYNIKNVHNFKREKISTKLLAMAKKKYISITLDNEGVTYAIPSFDVTGVEIKRTDSSLFTRENAEKVVRQILFTEDESAVIDTLKKLKKKYKLSDPSVIGRNSNVSFEKYPMTIDPDDELDIKFALRTPMAVKSAYVHNHINKIEKLGLQPMTEGGMDKLTYVFVKPNNIFGVDTCGFIAKYPTQFDRYFEVDYETSFNRMFMPIIERIFDAFGWGVPNLDSISHNFVTFDD